MSASNPAIRRAALSLAGVLLLACASFAQTVVSVSGHLLISSGRAPDKTFARFQLIGCPNGQARIDGVGIFSDYTEQFKVDDSTGQFSGTLFPNLDPVTSSHAIDCNGVYGTTQYAMTPMYNNRPIGATVNYQVVAGTPFVLESAQGQNLAPVTATQIPVVTNPQGAQIITQPAGSVFGFNFGELLNWFDVDETGAPVNPLAGKERWYADSGSHLMSCRRSDGTNCNPAASGGSGTVTSVGLALPNIFNISGSPVTASGTLTGALANENANTVFAGPASGVPAAPAFRALPSTGLSDFSSTAPSTAGKIPIYDPAATNSQGGTGAYVPGDPFVQGTQAAGSTTLPNPVGIGGSDYGGTPALRAAKVDSSGQFYIGNFPGSVTANIGTTAGLALDATLTGGNAKAQGNVASGAADSGNPIKTGGVFNATAPTVTSGQRVDQQMTNRGEAFIAKGPSGFSIDNSAFTANAGSNLNTSALALETGGNLAASKADLDTIAGVVSSNKAATKSADGDFVTLGAKTDAKSASTDTTSVSMIALMKELSFLLQNTLAVSAASLPLPAGAAADATLTNGNQVTKGNLSDNGAAAAGNRVATLPAIQQSNLPAAGTSGRDAAAITDLHRVLVMGAMPLSFPTYRANKLGLVPAASATDIACLPGNASNGVIVTRVQVSGTQTTAGIIDLQLIQRTTANTGSSTSMTVLKSDTGDASAASVPVTYTANPTINSTVGNYDSYKLGVMAPETATPNDVYIWRPDPFGESIVLRGTAQEACVNLNGVTTSGGSFNITFVWMEVPNL